MMRPFVSPVDGRVADINRRITDSHATTKQVQVEVEAVHAHMRDVGRQVTGVTTELGAYAAASVESTTYVGAELRRVEDQLESLTDTLKEHSTHLLERIETDQKRYVEHLNHATHMPLEQLDGAVANLVNYATGHRGFAAQAGLWFNPPVTVELGEGNARLAGVNERIVELPFAFGALARTKPTARILDIGGAESTFSLAAASLGYTVTVIDLHPVPFSHPNLECIVGKFEDWAPKAGRFDAVFLISTIEHFGLGAYGEATSGEDADRVAVSMVGKMLENDGFLVITAPYGRAKVDGLERTYDDVGLDALLSGWTVIDRQILRRLDKLTWVAVREDEDVEDGVAMIVARPDRRA